MRAPPSSLAPRCGVSAALAVLVAFGCSATDPRNIERDPDAGNQPPKVLDGGIDPPIDLPDAAPHAVLGISPSHGSFVGGEQVLVRGNGFSSDVKVWFGDRLVPEEDTTPIDPGRVQVRTPPGSAGLVSVTAQNGDDESTRAELDDAYHYDAFYLEPNSGPTSGGTVVTLFGDGTDWDEDTEVEVDGNPCLSLDVVSDTELRCTVPVGTAGAKTVRTIDAEGDSLDVLDGFTYGDSDNGFRGGLSGDSLEDSIKVLVLDSFTGTALPGVTVILGDSLDDAEVLSTDTTGIALFEREGLGPTLSVTVARDCFQPITFVDVPVDTVTVYLDPILDFSCIELSDLPPGVGSRPPSLGSSVSGELVWPQASELGELQGFTNVPAAQGDDERKVAYVFGTSSNPTTPFRLPGSGQAVTEFSSGEVGYRFRLSTIPGNATYYALAGIENRSLTPPVFTAYAMGVAWRVTTEPGRETTEVLINMDVPLDHRLELELDPPASTPRGPDRLRGSAAIRLGETGYALLPVGLRAQLLPSSQPFTFTGVPPLAGVLTGTQYVVSGTAASGPNEAPPRSVLGLFATSSSAETLSLGPFVSVPVLSVPETGAGFDGQRLTVDYSPGGEEPSLMVATLTSGGGLSSWTVVAPAERRSISLPALHELDSKLAIKRGALTVGVALAKIDNFVYGSLRYRDLGARGWSAYAEDVIPSSF